MANKKDLLHERKFLERQLEKLDLQIEKMGDCASVKDITLPFAKLSITEQASIYNYNAEIFKWFAENENKSIDDYLEEGEPQGALNME